MPNLIRFEAHRRASSRVVRFNPFEIDLEAGELRKHGSRIRLREQCFQVLACLLERPGQLVVREDLYRRLWGDTVFVQFDNNLNAAVARLRATLGDSRERPLYIETVPKRGYRFIADVCTLAPAATAEGPSARLLVLPFVGGDPCANDVLTDDVIAALACVAPEGLGIISRTTAMHYKRSRKGLARIAAEVDAQYVLEGAAQPGEGRVSISVRLVRAGDETHVYATRCDVAAADLRALEDRIAHAIVSRVARLSAPATGLAGLSA